MSTLVIKNVDLNELDKQRLLLVSLETKLQDSEELEALRSVIDMLDAWSDDRYHKKLGSIANQKAKESQQSFDFAYKVCENCGWEGIGETCQSCGSQALTDTEFVK